MRATLAISPSPANRQGRDLVSQEISDSPLAPPPYYFAVATGKLVVMSLCTMGLYGTYWFYKNWALIKEREHGTISPVWRSLLEFIFCYPCLTRMRATAQANHIEVALPAGPLTAGFVLVGLLGAAPAPGWQLSALAVLFLVPAQRAANRINAQLAPGHDANRCYSALNLAFIAVGGGLSLVSMILALLPGG